METKITQERFKQIKNLVMLGYDDYIAARFLINNNFLMQGVLMASSSVEKYLKALLLALKGKVPKIHLDKLDNLKIQFQDTEYFELFDHLDSSFLLVLGKAYKFRYYDNIKEADTVGFFVNQFLGELDYSVFAIELLFNEFKDQNGTPWQSPLRKAIKEKNENLFKDNYILNNIDKKEFMTRATLGFGLHFNPLVMEPFIIGTVKKFNVPYDGKIMLIEAVEDVKQ